MSPPGGAPPSRNAVALGLLFVLALRLIHLRYAIAGPLTWQMGADEDYYYRFGRDVAAGGGGISDIFSFMDPLYGYIVGAVLLLDAGVFPLYLLQIAVDCSTAAALYLTARELGRPQAGLFAIVLYGITGTAIAYTAALLKATWVASFIAWWVYAAVRLAAEGSGPRWLTFGFLCGVGVALRANLLLLAPIAVLVFAWRLRRAPISRRAAFALLFGAGLCLPLAVLTARNVAISGKASPLPNNGGIVLHQLYNPENPAARAGVPSFAGRYSAPENIWRAYRAEAERRAGRPLPPQQVDAYWKSIALAYLVSRPSQAVGNMVRKLREASAYPEVPNTRNYGDERKVSPLLAALPLPFGWLFALGLPGLVLLLVRDRRGLLVLVPLAVGAVTLAVFFAEDRFRFHTVAPLVLGAGFWLDHVGQNARGGRIMPSVGAAAISLALGGWSILQARLLIPDFPSDSPRLAWGYIKSGQRAQAERVLAEAETAHPLAPGLLEIRGFLAMRDERWTDAAEALQMAAAERPDRHETWHNLSISLEKIGRLPAALDAERRASRLAPQAGDYPLREGDLLLLLGRPLDAARVWSSAARLHGPSAAGAAARRRLEALGDQTGQPARGD